MRSPEVLRCTRHDVRKELHAHGRHRDVDGSTLVLRGWAQGTSIFILPTLCPPMEISMKTMGLPPAAPGIAPMPDIRVTYRNVRVYYCTVSLGHCRHVASRQ